MKAEILAPAGSYESLIAAVHAGADAVYTGGTRFGARAYAGNLDLEKMKEAIDYCHLHGRKLYVTVNTLLKEREVSQELGEYLRPLYEWGLDAVIVQDLGVLSYVRRHFPDLDVHASTQMTVTGAEGCRFLEEQGVTRVVTSRELSLEEIREIRCSVNIEIESFVHGALCYCYSGQCLYSSLIGGRSGNRGRCAQPCRLPYHYSLKKDFENKQEVRYLLSPKDICTLEILPDILDAGVFSLKIEGRMKRPEYTAGVVSVYRKYVDAYLKAGRKGYQVTEKDKRELMDLYNRGGFSKGYYETRNGREMMSLLRPNHYGTEAVRASGIKKGKLQLQALEDLSPRDALEIGVDASGRPKEFLIKEAVKRGQVFSMDAQALGNMPVGSVLHRVRNEKLLQELKETYVDRILKEKINGYLMISKGQPAILTVTMGNSVVTQEGAIPSIAQKQPLTEEKVRKQMEKTGNTPFVFEHLEIQLEEGCFVPMQALNELRRGALDQLRQQIVTPYRRGTGHVRKAQHGTAGLQQEPEGEYRVEREDGSQIWIALESADALKQVIKIEGLQGIYLDSSSMALPLSSKAAASYCKMCHAAGKQCCYILPHIFRSKTRRLYEEEDALYALSLFDGLLVKNLESFLFLKQHGLTGNVIIDHNVYTYNRYARAFWQKQGVLRDTAPLELNARELEERGCRGSELVVYGYLPMMVSAQCLQKTTGTCEKRPGTGYLTDRKGKKFHVKYDCQVCCNTIYNSAPLVLMDCKKEIDRLEPKALRLQFTREPVSEIVRITENYIRNFRENKNMENDFLEFTRGHFRRGIE